MVSYFPPSCIPKRRIYKAIYRTLAIHFLQNHKMNPIKLWNLKKFHDLRVWGLRNWIWVLWVQKMYQDISPEPKLQFSQKEDPIFSRVISWIKSNHQILKNFWTLLGSGWSLEIMDFTWVRKFHQAKVQSPSSNFHKHDSFYLES